MNKNQTYIDTINQLISFHRASLEVCDAAASRLDDVEDRSELRDMVEDHLRHVDRLARCVESMGGSATRTKADLPHSRDDVRPVRDSSALLHMLRSDHQVVANAYQDHGAFGDVPDLVSDAVARGQAIVEQHGTRLARTMGALRAG
ncbi:MAG: hypothetical protein AAF715_30925 [Myxococcota bacterium]